LTRVSIPTTIIYGELDKIIAAFNLPGLLKENPNIKAIKTPGPHGITIDKYSKISAVIKNFLKEEA
jgi:pimeloyl-ACP methyl ester carboxylesterase